MENKENKIQEIKKYVAEDGKEFYHIGDAIEYQEFMNNLYKLCKLLGISAKKNVIDGKIEYKFDFDMTHGDIKNDKKIISSLIENKDNIIIFLHKFDNKDVEKFKKNLDKYIKFEG